MAIRLWTLTTGKTIHLWLLIQDSLSLESTSIIISGYTQAKADMNQKHKIEVFVVYVECLNV